MSQRRRNKRGGRRLCDSMRQLSLASLIQTPRGTAMSPTLDQAVRSKWSNLCEKVPPIFLHGEEDFEDHISTMCFGDMNYKKVSKNNKYTKVIPSSYLDHDAMVRYFNHMKVAYHTFGLPSKRVIKVIVKGLPKQTQLFEVKKELKNLSVPVYRIHEMKTGFEYAAMLIIVVVPHTPAGYKMLQVKKILGHEVKLEPPHKKVTQCHRCQAWGHSQKYCHGEIKCVKCAENHFSNRCTLNKNNPLKCANCDRAHTANYKECSDCPLSAAYKLNQEEHKANKAAAQSGDAILGQITTGIALCYDSSSDDDVYYCL